VFQNQQSAGSYCFIYSYFFYSFKKNYFRLINGKELTAKDGVQIEKDVNSNKYTLNIPKLNPSLHAGVLTIKATNVIGTVTHDVNINILGKFLLLYIY
jgi:hypothetical protein